MMTLQGPLQDLKLKMPFVELPAEIRQMSHLDNYWLVLEASQDSLLIPSSYPILTANHILNGMSHPA